LPRGPRSRAACARHLAAARAVPADLRRLGERESPAARRRTLGAGSEADRTLRGPAQLYRGGPGRCGRRGGDRPGAGDPEGGASDAARGIGDPSRRGADARPALAQGRASLAGGAGALRRDPQLARGRLTRQRELVHLRGVLEQQLALHARREALQAALLRLLHRRVETRGVREVGSEHQVVLADPLDRGAGIAFEPVRSVDLALEVLGRAQLQIVDAVLDELIVEALEHERQPADAALHRYELELREAVEQTP